MDIVFLHGGPGFNSIAEKALLGPLLAREGIHCRFWNEPSPRRPEDGVFDGSAALTGLLESAEKAIIDTARASRDGRVHLVAHSFGSIAATLLTLDLEKRSQPSPVSLVTLISPALDLDTALTNTMTVAAGDYSEDCPEKEAELRALIASGPQVLNQEMIRGLELALSDPALLTHYWVDQTRLAQAAGALAGPEAQLDITTMFAVLAEFGAGRPLSRVRSSLPGRCNVLFGARDPIARRREQEAVLTSFYADIHVTEFESASHFVHIDDLERSFACLVSAHREYEDSVGSSVTE